MICSIIKLYICIYIYIYIYIYIFVCIIDNIYTPVPNESTHMFIKIQKKMSLVRFIQHPVLITYYKTATPYVNLLISTCH